MDLSKFSSYQFFLPSPQMGVAGDVCDDMKDLRLAKIIY